MKKEQAQQYITDHLAQGENLVGFFQAVTAIKFWMFLLCGPLAMLSMKMYFVAVTQKGVHFHKLNFIGKISDSDFFTFDEIKHVKIGKGMLQRPMTFTFNNERIIKLKAQLKGMEKVAKITPEVQTFLENNTTTPA